MMTFRDYAYITAGEYKIIINVEDYDKLKGYGWFIKRCGQKRNKLYACRNEHYQQIQNNGWCRWSCRTIYMHRDILQAPPGFQVHHINGNTLDNRRSNLCLLTKEEHDKRHGVFA